MKRWFNIFVYVSIIFVLYALWKADYLTIPTIDNHLFLFISITLLFITYLSKSVVWSAGLKSNNIMVTLKDSVASTGMAELGKYIPGKLWAVMGRAMYVALHYPISTVNASAISFNVQVLTIWSGIMAGATGILFIEVPAEWIYLLVGSWLILSCVLFIRQIHDLIQKLAGKILKREVKIPLIDVRKRKEIILWLFIDWFVRILAFYFFVLSLTPSNPGFATALGFPLAVTLGIVAVVVPGGIGVREGVLVFWLKGIGLPLETATTIAVAARLWSLAGETGIFLIALLLKKPGKLSSKANS